MTLLAILLAGCGGGDASSSGSSGSAARGSPPSGPASAEEVAEEARGDVDCPARIKTPKRAAGAPVIDVEGVAPGMTYDEAANVVMCTHDLLIVKEDPSRGFQIQLYGAPVRKGFNASFARERVQKTSRQIMQEMQDNAMARSSNRAVRDVLPGQAKWYVGTIGLPGEERVVNAAREERFEEGGNPSMAAVRQALIDKYGAPTWTQSRGNGAIELHWNYDPRGRAITETSPLYRSCSGQADPDAGVNLSPDCGVAVNAVIQPLRENPGLSDSVQVGVVDQAGGYQMLTATEQALQQAEMQRRAAEVEAADKKFNVARSAAASTAVTARNLAQRRGELVNPDDSAIVMLYFDLAGIAPPIDNWVEDDTRVRFAPAPDKAMQRTAVRAELEAAASGVRDVGAIRLTMNSNLSDYDPTYQEFTVRALSPSSVVTFKALGQKVSLRFANGNDAQVWRVPSAQSQAIRDRVGRGNNVSLDALLKIVSVQPAPAGGSIVTEIVEYELRENRSGVAIARVRVGHER